MTPAEAIRQRLTMREVLHRYGFELERSGFMPCPFHREKTPSFGVYDEGRKWKCFGCGKQGGVIDFVMELYHIGFLQAVIRIDNDFALGLGGKSIPREEAEQFTRRRQEKDRRGKEFERVYDELLTRFAVVDRFLSTNLPTEESGGVFGSLLALRRELWQKTEKAYQEWKKEADS